MLSLHKLPLLVWTAFFNGGSFTRTEATDYTRMPTYAMPFHKDSVIKHAIQPAIDQHQGLSGFRIIASGQGALLDRLALIEAAERTLDIHYYSIQNDKSGKLVMDAILSAADRGVRVRMLMDDITHDRSDRTWTLLDAHPHISLRIFNPLAASKRGMLSKITAILLFLPQCTCRMHNKAFIVDNQIAIVGGCNLGDAYFDNSQNFTFRDIDLLTAGPITQQISKSFDNFWNGKHAFPIKLFDKAHCTEETPVRSVNRFRTQCARETRITKFPVAPAIIDQLQNNDPPLLWAKAEVVTDAPDIADRPRGFAHSQPLSRLASRLASRLEQLAAGAEQEVVIVDPYFIPETTGIEWLKAIVDRGVRVRILTNSLASTDVVAMHSGYRRYREALLKAGVQLYETKTITGEAVYTGSFANCSLTSSSLTSLHTKIYLIDRKHILLGTMNLDPRSERLHSEMTLGIENELLAEQIAAMFEKALKPSLSYRLQFLPDSTRQLEWISEEKNQEIRYKSDPDVTVWRKLKANLYSFLG